MTSTLDQVAHFEKAHMEALVNKVNGSKTILEVGFGSGFSSELIQKRHPESHAILVNTVQEWEKVKKWAERYPHVTIINKSWQEALDQLGRFDTILIHGYPENIIDSKASPLPSLEQVKKSVEKGTQLVKEAHDTFPEMLSMHYSDNDLREFCSEIIHIDPQGLEKFLGELKKRGQISASQYNKVSQKYLLGGSSFTTFWESFSQDTSMQLAFILKCVDAHLSKGGRLVCFLPQAASKFEDSQFFEKIITNSHLNYEESSLAIKSSHFPENKALVMTIEKK